MIGTLRSKAGELTFSNVEPNGLEWCGKCRSNDQIQEMIRIHHVKGDFLSRHVSCLDRVSCVGDRLRCRCEHGISARVVHRDVTEAFGIS